MATITLNIGQDGTSVEIVHITVTDNLMVIEKPEQVDIIPFDQYPEAGQVYDQRTGWNVDELLAWVIPCELELAK